MAPGITKVIPESYPVGKTALLPPGPGAVVSLEFSPDLIHWTTATNRVYTNMGTVLFFGINLQRIQAKP